MTDPKFGLATDARFNMEVELSYYERARASLRN